jgi:hypothetical protein
MAGGDFKGTDLRLRDLSNHVLFDADLRGAKLHGAKIALVCHQFDGVKLDNEQVAYLLLMISQANIDPRYVTGIQETVARVVGKDAYQALQRLLRLV